MGKKIKALVMMNGNGNDLFPIDNKIIISIIILECDQPDQTRPDQTREYNRQIDCRLNPHTFIHTSLIPLDTFYYH